MNRKALELPMSVIIITLILIITLIVILVLYANWHQQGSSLLDRFVRMLRP